MSKRYVFTLALIGWALALIGWAVVQPCYVVTSNWAGMIIGLIAVLTFAFTICYVIEKMDKKYEK